MTPLVIVPARAGSKGVPNKNFRALPDGSNLLWRAIDVGLDIGSVVVTTDDEHYMTALSEFSRDAARWLKRPTELAQDGTPMSAVVEDVLTRVDGPPDQPIVLLQPTVPFRKVEQVRHTLELLALELDAVVVATVRRAPVSPDRMLVMTNDFTINAATDYDVMTRQKARAAYLFDGTCYAAKRENAYLIGARPSMTWYRGVELTEEPYVNIDTEADWQRACEIIRNRQNAG